jgi:hypothetical protein
MAVKYGDQPFQEAIDYFRGKLPIDTEKWNDLEREQNDIGFMVAGATQGDVLNDIFQFTDQAIADGIGLDQFRRDFLHIVEKRGWTGWTGETTAKGRNWRAAIIYDTNMRQAYNAGRERQMADPELRKARPYGLYKHGDSISPREEHLAWDNKVVPLDDPWWDTNTPQNGWFCSCKKFTLSEREVKKRGLTITSGKQMPFQGKGIDEGFDYRPGGDEVRRINKALRDKTDKYPPALRSDVAALLDGVIAGLPSFIRKPKRPLDPALLANKQDIKTIEVYSNALNNPEILTMIQRGGIYGSAVLAHELRELTGLYAAGLDPVKDITEILARFNVAHNPLATPKIIRANILFHLAALKAEVEYAQAALAGKGIRAELGEVANALYDLYDNPSILADRTWREFDAIGIEVKYEPVRKDIRDAL